MAWQTITTVTQPRSAPITGAAEFQRTAIKEKSQNSSHTALQTTTSPTGCGGRGRVVTVKQKEGKGINPNTDFSLTHSLGTAWVSGTYHLWNTTAVYNSHCVIGPTEPTESYNLTFAKMHMYKITCARQCVTLSHRYQLIHRYSLIYLHPRDISFLKPRGNFITPHPDLQVWTLQRIKGYGFWNFVSSSSLGYQFIPHLLSLLVWARSLANPTACYRQGLTCFQHLLSPTP